MLKRSLSIHGHRTSIALEAEFWTVLEKAAQQGARSLPDLIAQIDQERLTAAPAPSLSSALRVFALSYVNHDTARQDDAL